MPLPVLFPVQEPYFEGQVSHVSPTAKVNLHVAWQSFHPWNQEVYSDFFSKFPMEKVGQDMEELEVAAEICLEL